MEYSDNENQKREIKEFCQRLITSEVKQKGQRPEMVAAPMRHEKQDQSECIIACQDEPERQTI